jgi:inositol oxygenase
MSNQTTPNATPLKSLDEWEDDVLLRYPDPETIAQSKGSEEYRNYEDPSRDTVREFYRLNHSYQTYQFVQDKRQNYLRFNKKEMPVWDAFNFLNQLVDDSDPDTDIYYKLRKR